MKLMSKTKLITLIITALVLSGCGDMMNDLNNVGRAPALDQVSMPQSKKDYKPVDWDVDEDESPQPKYANSLWQQGSRAFFKDMKARRIGDILKVAVKVQDQAKLDNATTRNRTSSESAQAPALFGMEEKIIGALPGVADPSNLLSIGSTGSSAGTGSVNRKETVETEVAAMVTQILPNGNLVIHGDQEIRVNFEVRKITVDGIVRQEDISADNSIDSNQIAEARISYGGRGQLTNIQQPRVGTQVMDILSPF